MTLPRNLVSEALEVTDVVLHLEDENTHESMEFITFGDFDFDDRHYFYGMDAEDYEKCFGPQNIKEMRIQFLEEVVNTDGHICYSSDIYFSETDEKKIYNIIKNSLESIVVAAKYGIN